MPGPGTKKGLGSRKSGDRPKAFEDSSTDLETSSSSDDAATRTAFDPTEFRKSHLDLLAQLKRHKSLFSIISDVDKCYKKIHEGVEAVEQLWAKFEATASSNGREKCENDLKREIKKLQRLRDQVRGWLSGSEIKDKTILNETKKLIERYMEKFKLTEREIKTKTYSTVGLSQPTKVDPLDEEADDTRIYLNEKLEELSVLIDNAECQLEVFLSVEKKRRDQAAITDVQDRISRYRYHVSQLEAVLRLLAACRIVEDEAKEKLPEFFNRFRDLKEDVEHFISHHMEPDFEEYEMMYDDIEGLQELQESTVDLLTGRDEPSEDGVDSLKTIVEVENNPILTSDRDAQEKLDNQDLDCNANGRNLKNEGPSFDKTVETDHSASSDVEPRFETPFMFSDVVSGRSSAASQFYDAEAHGNFCEEFKVNLTLGETESTDASSYYPISSEVSRVSSHGSPNGSVSLNMVGEGIRDFDSLWKWVRTPQMPGFDTMGAAAMPGWSYSNEVKPIIEMERRGLASTIQEDVLPGIWNEIDPDWLSGFQEAFSSTSKPKMMTPIPPSIATSPMDSVPSPQKNIHRVRPLGLGGSLHSSEEVKPKQEKSVYPGARQANVGPGYRNEPKINSDWHSGFQESFRSSSSSPRMKEAFIPASLAANPLGPAPLTSENLHQLRLLGAAHEKYEQNRVDYVSHPPMNTLFPKYPFSTPSYYPQEPLPFQTFESMPDEDLCYAFYDSEGSLKQAKIASILKQREYRYHKGEKSWFRRLCEPTTITSTYEIGTYKWYDLLYMKFQKKENFVFMYKDLEGFNM